MHGVLIRDKKILSEEEKMADIEAGECAMGKLVELITRKKKCDYSDISLSLSMEVLRLNPELILAWNFRRQILLDRNDLELLQAEIHVLNNVMIGMRMTKSYCLWTHRRWIMTRLGDNVVVLDGILDGESKMIERILELDCRNFHAWSYRNWFNEKYNLFSKEINFNYSTKLIESDFSNYAAWFLRMQNCPDLVVYGTQELEFVYSAIFTEPNDQSAWQYRDWLIGQRPELIKQDTLFRQELENIIDEKDMKYLLLSQLRDFIEGKDYKIELVDKLSIIDPMRKGYYHSLLCM